jgi:Patatin phospholipase
MFDVMTQDKEIRYSSRTRAGTDDFKRIQKLRRAAAGLLDQLPRSAYSRSSRARRVQQWPPNAAVRQRSIALTTLSWSRAHKAGVGLTRAPA